MILFTLDHTANNTVSISGLFFQTATISIWASLFWLVIIFLVMLFLNRWITLHINGVGLIVSNSQLTATWLYFFLFLPGILLHEVSHYVVAWLLRANPSKLTLWPKAKRGRVVLGSVEVRNADPVVHSLIGVAPLVFGSIIVWLIARFLQFDLLAQTFIDGNMERFYRGLFQSLNTPDFWLWLYLLFAISNAMLPSPADRVYWRPVLLFIGVIIVLLVSFDLFPAIPGVLQETLLNIISIFVFAMSTVIVVNLFFITFIFLLELTLGVTTGRRVQY